MIGQGYGLNWSPHNASLLLSGSYDNTVLLFDLEGATGKPAKGGPLHAFLEHTGVRRELSINSLLPHSLCVYIYASSFCSGCHRELATDLH